MSRSKAKPLLGSRPVRAIATDPRPGDSDSCSPRLTAAWTGSPFVAFVTFCSTFVWINPRSALRFRRRARPHGTPNTNPDFGTEGNEGNEELVNGRPKLMSRSASAALGSRPVGAIATDPRPGDSDSCSPRLTAASDWLSPFVAFVTFCSTFVWINPRSALRFRRRAWPHGTSITSPDFGTEGNEGNEELVNGRPKLMRRSASAALGRRPFGAIATDPCPDL